MRVLVTGGTGVLGRAVVRELRRGGAQVRGLSRHASSSGEGVEWVRGDLTSGAGLAEALADVDTVIHCATVLKAGDDLKATRLILAEARRAGVGHFVYPSIVGMDAVTFYDYYAAKLEGERLVRESGLPFSIQRATQFYDLVQAMLLRLRLGPVQLVPRGAVLQPVDAGTVAARIAQTASQSPAGRLPDLAGPQIRPLPELAGEWLRARGQEKRVVDVPIPLPLTRAMASGHLVSVTAERVGQTWGQWLQAHAGEPSRYAGR